MNFKQLKQLLINFKEELNNDDRNCNHHYVIVFKKSNVLSVGYVTYGICLDCGKYITLKSDYDYFNNKSVLIDATFDIKKFEIIESYYDNIDESLYNELIKKYNEIKFNNSTDYIKSELEKIIKENTKILKRV